MTVELETPNESAEQETEAAPEGAAEAPDAAEAAASDATGESTSADELAWVEEFGGAEAVREAVQFRQSLKTEEGAIDAFVEFGIALGLTPEQLSSMFPASVVEETADQIAAAEEEANRPLTKAEVEELIAKQVIEPLAAKDEVQQQAAMRVVVLGQLDTMQVPETEREKLLLLADAHLKDEDRNNPAAIKAAIELGAKDYDAWIDAQVAARIGRKVSQAAGVPDPLAGGTTAGGEVPAEPQSLKEAKQRIREAQ